jgi:hypothetical protein
MRAFPICAPAFLLVLLGCPWAPPRGSFHERVIEARHGRLPTVTLSPTDRVWDRAYFFGPYTPDAVIDSTLGFRCEACSLVELRRRDDIHMVVLTRGNALVQVQELPRSAVDVRTSLLKTPFAPGTTFKLTEEPSGWVWLDPK